MGEKIKALALILILGWFLGYIHSYVASKQAREEARLEAASLSEKVAELTAKLDVIPRITVKATAYSNDKYSINVPRWRDGMTATNKRAQRGYVAADWTLFPPGTRFYIPGYGEAVVEDRGSAVKGYHLDLFVDSREEALKWGVKKLDVYVLERADNSMSPSALHASS